jgi:hypothetical protein
MRLVRQGILRPPVKLVPNGRCLFPEANIDEDIARRFAAVPSEEVASA